MSGVLTKKLGRIRSLVSCETSCRYSSISHFSVAPGEVRVGLVEADHAEAAHHVGRVNASDKKITSGSVLRTSANSHSQNITGLVCGLSTRKTLTPWSIQ